MATKFEVYKIIALALLALDKTAAVKILKTMIAADKKE